MGVAISGLTAATVVNETDQFEIEQAGVSKSLTKTLLRSLLLSDPAFATLLPQAGDVPVWSGSDWVTTGQAASATTAHHRWRVVHTDAYTEAAPASTSTITFAGGGPTSGIATSGTAWFTVGYPVRFKQSGTYYYAICTAVTTTLLTIAGAPLDTGNAIQELAVGTPEMVTQLVFPMTEAANFSADTGSTQLATFGLTYFKWRRPKAYLVTFSAIEKTTAGATEPKINVLINGSAVSTNDTNLGVALVAATWVDNSAVAINVSNYDINWDETIEFDVTNTPSAAADYLTVSCTFITP